MVKIVYIKFDIFCFQTFKTRDQLASHTCDEAADSKKHLSSQLPRKASGMFKSKKPTPKRQILSKNSTDKEKVDKSKPEEVERKVMKDIYFFLQYLAGDNKMNFTF